MPTIPWVTPSIANLVTITQLAFGKSTVLLKLEVLVKFNSVEEKPFKKIRNWNFRENFVDRPKKSSNFVCLGLKSAKKTLVFWCHFDTLQVNKGKIWNFFGKQFISKGKKSLSLKTYQWKHPSQWCSTFLHGIQIQVP